MEVKEIKAKKKQKIAAKKSIKSILFTLPPPNNENSPYIRLAKEYDLKIDFSPFISVEPMPIQEFRLQKVDISKYSSLFFTSKYSIDYYFAMAKQLRHTVDGNTRYFCVSETIALYLQKHIKYRKRRIFFGETSVEELIPLIEKHLKPNEALLIPTTDVSSEDNFKIFTDAGINIQPTIFFKTVVNDLSHYENVTYDVIAFYSPLSVYSLYKNFPNFKQNDTIIVAYGMSTQKALLDKKLKIQIKVPNKNFSSVASAIENFIKKK